MDHAKTGETVRKFGYTGASVARFPEMTTGSVNRMARPEDLTEFDAWDKQFAPYIPLSTYRRGSGRHALRAAPPLVAFS